MKEKKTGTGQPGRGGAYPLVSIMGVSSAASRVFSSGVLNNSLLIILKEKKKRKKKEEERKNRKEESVMAREKKNIKRQFQTNKIQAEMRMQGHKSQQQSAKSQSCTYMLIKHKDTHTHKKKDDCMGKKHLPARLPLHNACSTRSSFM